MKRLYDKDGKEGLYNICEWYIETYPDDIFVSKEHPVVKIRELCKKILENVNGV